jgi:adenosylmethionine-8-amino-7-oxononanoate aminotransferase
MSEDWKPWPDILCLSKAITSGYLPLAATLTTDKIYQRFQGEGKRFDYGPTASGHPVCAAVALRNIDIIIREKLPENAAKIGDYLKSRLRGLMNSHKIIGEVRGKGLMLGIELVNNKEKKAPLDKKDTFNITVDTAILGLLIYPADNILGLFPPLIINKEIADKIVEILDQSLETGITTEIARKARLAKEFAASKLG